MAEWRQPLMKDPEHIVPVSDFSTETLESIIVLLEVSTEFEHMVYREAELDAVWSITGFFLVEEKNSARFKFVEQLHKAAHEAHDLVADGRTAEAARLLRDFLSSSGKSHVIA
jgi:hypothetical protein